MPRFSFPYLAAALLVTMGAAADTHRDPLPLPRPGSATESADAQRLATLERSVRSLQATIDDQSRQLRCFEVQRAMKAAWVEHDHALQRVVTDPCNEVKGVCPDTGLPPNTFRRYRERIAEVVGLADAPFDTVRAKWDERAKLPQALVENEANTRIWETRAAAEKASEAYFAACTPPEATPVPGAAASAM
jgi:hypothetical protein